MTLISGCYEPSRCFAGTTLARSSNTRARTGRTRYEKPALNGKNLYVRRQSTCKVVIGSPGNPSFDGYDLSRGADESKISGYQIFRWLWS